MALAITRWPGLAWPGLIHSFIIIIISHVVDYPTKKFTVTLAAVTFSSPSSFREEDQDEDKAAAAAAAAAGGGRALLRNKSGCLSFLASCCC